MLKRFYHVYYQINRPEHTFDDNPNPNDIVAVDGVVSGFSFLYGIPLFNIIWAIFNYKIWPAIWLFLINVIFAVCTILFNFDSLMFWWGLFYILLVGNLWQHLATYHLHRKGFLYGGIFMAHNVDHAILKFYKKISVV